MPANGPSENTTGGPGGRRVHVAAARQSISPAAARQAGPLRCPAATGGPGFGAQLRIALDFPRRRFAVRCRAFGKISVTVISVATPTATQTVATPMAAHPSQRPPAQAPATPKQSNIRRLFQTPVRRIAGHSDDKRDPGIAAERGPTSPGHPLSRPDAYVCHDHGKPAGIAETGIPTQPRRDKAARQA